VVRKKDSEGYIQTFSRHDTPCMTSTLFSRQVRAINGSGPKCWIPV